MNIFTEPFYIRFADIDQSDTLTLAASCGLFQEAAINHAELLGAGREVLGKAGLVWIMSRFSVVLEKRPRYREKVCIRSWPRGVYKLFAVRDYDIRDAEDRVLVRGRAGWLVLDLEKRRPVRPQPVTESLPLNEGMDAFPGAVPNNPPPALIPRNYTSPPLERQVLYSDIDYNGHMNNTRYIQWVEDLMESHVLVNGQKIRLDINYLAELRYGETVELFTLPLEEPCTAAFAVEGRRTGENGEHIPVFRAELRTWR